MLQIQESTRRTRQNTPAAEPTPKNATPMVEGIAEPTTGFDFGSISVFPPEPQVGPEGGELSPDVADRIRAQQGGGIPLSPPVQQRMEAGFGHDFAAVRVHVDGESDTLNRSLSAHAFTFGSDIYLGEQAARTSEYGGDRMLAHELTHVVQQRGTSSGEPLTVDPTDAPGEREASAMAQTVSTGNASSTLIQPAVQSAGALQRVAAAPDAPAAPATPADIAVQNAFNPMDINHKLLRAIDQSDVKIAGRGEYGQYIFKRHVDFDDTVAALKNLTAKQIEEVNKAYSAHENGRTIQDDLFGGGESGYPTDLTADQVVQLGALLGGTQAGPGASAQEKQNAEMNAAGARAAELYRLLHSSIGRDEVERIMTLLRQDAKANTTLGAAYASLGGGVLGGDLRHDLYGLGAYSIAEMNRALKLLEGDVVGADAYKVHTEQLRIEGIDERIAKLRKDIADGESYFEVMDDTREIKELAEERKKLAEDIEKRGEQASADALASAPPGTDPQAAVKARVSAVLGDTNALANQIGGDDATIIRALASDDPVPKAAAQLHKAAQSGDLKAELLTATLRGLRTEAEDRAQRAFPKGDPRIESEAKRLSDDYFFRIRDAYNSLVSGDDKKFDELVDNLGDEGDQSVNIGLMQSHGKLSDIAELIFALQGDRKDTATVERVLRDKSAKDIADLKEQYKARTGRTLDHDLFGEGATHSKDANQSNESYEYKSTGYSYEMVKVDQGKASGTSRLNLEDYMQRPDTEGGPKEVIYILDRAEREYQYTLANGGITGGIRDAFGNEERDLLDESIQAVRKFAIQYGTLVGWMIITDPAGENIGRPEMIQSQQAQALIVQMRMARATIRGDRDAYEKATAALRAIFEAVAIFVIQAALTALLSPAAAALLEAAELGADAVEAGVMAARIAKFAANTSVNIASTIGANLAVHGSDYSVAMLKADLLSGLGGSIGSEAVGKMLGPVAKGLSQKLGPKASQELIALAQTAGNVEGGAWAQGEAGDLSLQNLVKTHLIGKAAGALTHATGKATGLTPEPTTKGAAVPEEHTAPSEHTTPTERSTPAEPAAPAQGTVVPPALEPVAPGGTAGAKTQEPHQLPPGTEQTTARPPRPSEHAPIDERTPVDGTPAGEEPTQVDITPAGEEPTQVDVTPAGEDPTQVDIVPAEEEPTQVDARPAGEEPMPVPQEVPGVIELPEGSAMWRGTPEETRDLYHRSVSSDPEREVALFRNVRTGEVVIGQGDARGVAFDPQVEIESLPGGWDEWQIEAHNHTIDPQTRVTPEFRRVPSSTNGDFDALQWESKVAGNQPRTARVDFVTERGPDHTTYGYDPKSTRPYTIDYPNRVTGERMQESFAKIEDYEAWFSKEFDGKSPAIPKPTKPGAPNRQVSAPETEGPGTTAPGETNPPSSESEPKGMSAPGGDDEQTGEHRIPEKGTLTQVDSLEAGQALQDQMMNDNSGRDIVIYRNAKGDVFVGWGEPGKPLNIDEQMRALPGEPGDWDVEVQGIEVFPMGGAAWRETPGETEDLYWKMRANDPTREVSYNVHKGGEEARVVQGNEKKVRPHPSVWQEAFPGGEEEWETPRHSHAIDPETGVTPEENRAPSGTGGDLEEVEKESANAGGKPRTIYIDIRVERTVGGETVIVDDVIKVDYDPNAEMRYTIDYPAPYTGERTPLQHESLPDFEDWYRKQFPGRRADSGERRAPGEPPGVSAPGGKDDEPTPRSSDSDTGEPKLASQRPEGQRATAENNLAIDKLVRGEEFAPLPKAGAEFARSEAAVAQAQRVLQDPNATVPEQLAAVRTLIERAVAEFRADFVTEQHVPSGEPFRLTADDLHLACELGRDVTAEAFMALVKDSPKAVLIERMQAAHLGIGARHGFAIVTLDGTQFLVDPTFAQFADQSGGGNFTAERMISSGAGSAVARDLLRDGFIPLTESTAREYVLGLGATLENADAAAEGLIAGNARVLTEIVRDGRVERIPGSPRDIENLRTVSRPQGTALSWLPEKIQGMPPDHPLLPLLKSLYTNLQALQGRLRSLHDD